MTKDNLSQIMTYVVHSFLEDAKADGRLVLSEKTTRSNFKESKENVSVLDGIKEAILKGFDHSLTENEMLVGLHHFIDTFVKVQRIKAQN